MTGRKTLEWKMRLKLADGRTYVGGYVGWKERTLYVADELSGEILEFDGGEVLDFDVRKYDG